MANGQKKPRRVLDRRELSRRTVLSMGGVIVAAQKPADRPKDSSKLLENRQAGKK